MASYTEEELRQANKNLKSLLEELPKDAKGRPCCPFCQSGTGDNKTSALYYNHNHGQPKPTVYCYSCGKTSDALEIYQVIHSAAGTVDAVKALCGMVSTGSGPTSWSHGSTTRPKNEKTAPRDDYSDFIKWSHNYLFSLQGNGSTGRQYLQARGIHSPAAKAFNLGYNPKYNQIVIPVCGNSGYICRNIDTKSEHRYYNRGKIDITAAGPAEICKPVIIVTEGTFDACAVWQALELQELERVGIIALNSIANKNKLLDKIRELETVPAAVVIMLDTDEKGTAAAAELKAALENMLIPAIVATVPAKDAAELITMPDGPDTLRKIIIGALQAAETGTTSATDTAEQAALYDDNSVPF